MADKNAPGTYVKNGVRCTTDAPFGDAGKGSSNGMGAPFDAPRSGGDNGLPQKIYDNIGGKAPAPSNNSSLGTIKTSR